MWNSGASYVLASPFLPSAASWLTTIVECIDTIMTPRDSLKEANHHSFVLRLHWLHQSETRPVHALGPSKFRWDSMNMERLEHYDLQWPYNRQHRCHELLLTYLDLALLSRKFKQWSEPTLNKQGSKLDHTVPWTLLPAALKTWNGFLKNEFCAGWKQTLDAHDIPNPSLWVSICMESAFLSIIF